MAQECDAIIWYTSKKINFRHKTHCGRGLCQVLTGVCGSSRDGLSGWENGWRTTGWKSKERSKQEDRETAAEGKTGLQSHTQTLTARWDTCLPFVSVWLLLHISNSIQNIKEYFIFSHFTINLNKWFHFENMEHNKVPLAVHHYVAKLWFFPLLKKLKILTKFTKVSTKMDGQWNSWAHYPVAPKCGSSVLNKTSTKIDLYHMVVLRWEKAQ